MNRRAARLSRPSEATVHAAHMIGVMDTRGITALGVGGAGS